MCGWGAVGGVLITCEPLAGNFWGSGLILSPSWHGSLGQAPFVTTLYCGILQSRLSIFCWMCLLSVPRQSRAILSFYTVGVSGGSKEEYDFVNATR